MTPDPHEVQTETIRYLLAVSAEKGEEIARLTAELAAAHAERDSLRTVAESRLMRMRTASQLLIAEIGAKGPENVDITAGRAVAVIEALRAEVARRGPVVEWEELPHGLWAEKGGFTFLVKPSGWWLDVADRKGDDVTVAMGNETGPAGKSAAEAAYRKAAGLA